jgi:pimeloyl-ACP methyl ester carboxylesterase
MLELLNPSLPGAARALADIARFRLKVATSGRAKHPEMVAARFMAPSQRENRVTVPALLADLRRFAPDWEKQLGQQRDLEQRMAALMGSMQRETLVLPSHHGGERIALYRWEPTAKPRKPRHALLCHGWESYALSYALVIERLLALGYTVHAMDHAAHGDSSGTYSGLPRFAEVLRDVSAHLGAQGIEVDLGVGHSLGAGAWLMGATKLGVRAKRLVLLAPFIDTPELLNAWLKLHGLSSSLRPDMQLAMMALHGPSEMDFPDMEIANLAARLTIPTTVVQDPKDFVAPMRHAKKLAAATPLVQCVSAPGAGHVGVLFHRDALAALEGATAASPAAAAAKAMRSFAAA